MPGFIAFTYFCKQLDSSGPTAPHGVGKLIPMIHSLGADLFHSLSICGSISKNGEESFS